MRSAVVLALMLAAAGAAPAAAKLPPGFIGVQADGPLFAGEVDVQREFAVMRDVGVQTIRLAIYWDELQPYPAAADVPPEQAERFSDEAGVPTAWGATDSFVAAAAQRGLRVLPVVLRAPAWARLHPELVNSPPTAAGRDAYARFLDALVRRYGPGGSFWTTHPSPRPLPIRQWQVWNEPDGVRDWSDQPGVADYVKLLKPAHAAIKAADPRARVILAGLVGRSWEHLAQVYRAGGRRYFDAAAIHPFSHRPADVVKILRLARRTMRRHGDARKPLVVSELSYPSARGKTPGRYGFEVTEKGQARRIRQVLPRVAAARRKLRIIAVSWSSWISYDRDPQFPFDYSGLRRAEGSRVVAKPAFRAFRSVVRRLRR